MQYSIALDRTAHGSILRLIEWDYSGHTADICTVFAPHAANPGVVADQVLKQHFGNQHRVACRQGRGFSVEFNAGYRLFQM